MTETLKPCPFCSERGFVPVKDKPGYFTECPVCAGVCKIKDTSPTPQVEAGRPKLKASDEYATREDVLIKWQAHVFELNKYIDSRQMVLKANENLSNKRLQLLYKVEERIRELNAHIDKLEGKP